MIVESRSNHWCHDDYENEVMGLLGNALGTTIEETDEDSNASNAVVSDKYGDSNGDKDLVDGNHGSHSENSEDEETDDEDSSNDRAGVEEEGIPSVSYTHLTLPTKA